MLYFANGLPIAEGVRERGLRPVGSFLVRMNKW
jgi:hypothetical protein